MVLSNDNLAQQLLSRAHPPETAAAIYTDKILHKPLILRPTSPDPTSLDARAARRLRRLRKEERTRRRRKPPPLSAKQKRSLGIYDLSKKSLKYETYVPLHQLWLGYMWEILDIEDGKPCYLAANSIGSKLASADYHGAEVEVVRCSCVDRVGTKGIVLKDTKFTFEVVTKNSTLRIIPKCDTIFRFEIPKPTEPIDTDMEQKAETQKDAKIQIQLQGVSATAATSSSASFIFELHGSQFQNRAIDRATRKFKQRRMDHL